MRKNFEKFRINQKLLLENARNMLVIATQKVENMVLFDLKFKEFNLKNQELGLMLHSVFNDFTVVK